MRKANQPHSFHIPVMGLGYTLETPLKVAKYGISSVVSIMDDKLCEDLRRVKSRMLNVPYLPITDKEPDSRAKRITTFLDFLSDQVDLQVENIKRQTFQTGSELDTYFELLPNSHVLKSMYEEIMIFEGSIREEMNDKIKSMIFPGKIDVNIMTKVDKINYDKDGNSLPREYSDALSALRGFVNSKIESSVVFSAGLNPALYNYAASFDSFFPNHVGKISKRITLKVSDYRSALIQGKYLAKKGLWVSEFRIESGLNCGGHAFATEGVLLGPILEEFKTKREELQELLWDACNQTLQDQGKPLLLSSEKIKITVQGGIGTAKEDEFLTNHYDLDGTGWGSPFLMVPEATNVDEDTLKKLMNAKKSDYFLSDASPLGVRFNNLKTSSGEVQRKERIAKDRPGSPCYKKFLSFSTEFTEKPICTASRQYLNLKIKQLKQQNLGEDELEKRSKEILVKDCLCEGLGAAALLANGETPARNLKAVTICPGPNLAYFSGLFSLKEMVGHIYGKLNIMKDPLRPHMFVKELQLYIDYLKEEVTKYIGDQPTKFETYVDKFKENLNQGVNYYLNLIHNLPVDTIEMMEKMKRQFSEAIDELNQIEAPKFVTS
ncbi:hypothetical protein MM239_13360 [Belliella sp. DSM 111904]|uniref:Uncharacterized protein n=1 Tax=Belliella filtrata TaxID=2923435 RepID=A0ABS9V212_9BACT|nr:hypothetical protein [Belliella filtrata]MCH7410389.1 hypothetical protein [Belliella filtrata]